MELFANSFDPYIIKFEVKQNMPGLTIRGHGRLRMTEEPLIKY